MVLVVAAPRGVVSSAPPPGRGSSGSRAGGGRQRKGARRGGDGLTPEDRRDWSRVAATLKPLRKASKDAPASPKTPATPADVGPAGAQSSAAPSKKTSSAPRSSASVKGAMGAGAAKPSDPSPLAVRRDRKTRRGQHDIDACIDLHGETQARALDQLTAFLHRAHGRGYGCVLVITGKGLRLDPPDPQRPFNMFERDEPGVLRRALPRWLSSPPLRALVRDYAPAHARHGGSGAWYVFLRQAGRGGAGDTR